MSNSSGPRFPHLSHQLANKRVPRERLHVQLLQESNMHNTMWSEFCVEAVFLRDKILAYMLQASVHRLFWSWSDCGKVRQYLNASFLHFLGLYFCDICFQNRDEIWIFFVVLQVPSLVILWARLLRKAVKTHGMKKALASRSQLISFRGVVNWARRSRFLDIGCERQPCPWYRRWKVFMEWFW